MTRPEQEDGYLQSDCPPIPGMKRFCHEAMATTFEVIVVHDDARYAQQAAAAAFVEVDRLEAELSRFIENSDIARINGLSANRPLTLGLDAFECLRLACRMYAETNRAFDITIGSLLGCWRNDDGTPRTPSDEQLKLARQRTGTHLLELDEIEHTVRLLASPVHVDLGGIGKGYAVDRMGESLRDWSIDVALIHGGYSSVLALDAPPDTEGWPLTLSDPDNHKDILARPFLKGRALGGSGVQKGGHIVDPRTAMPVKGKRAAWSSAPDAATADALSTAFMIMSPEEIERYCSRHPDVLAMLMLHEPERQEGRDGIISFGAWKGTVL
jgi:thiamine biosynthesis lipoprotein